jgi:large subunit ribosomal protein L24
MKLAISKGDMVEILAGNDRKKTGRVIALDTKQMRVTVEGINIRTKHARPSQANPKGGIISLEMPIHYSNVRKVEN